MTFQQLMYVAEIAKCGSFNKAAQNLYLSQSSISSGIKELEEELKIKIFQRSNRGVELTVEGKEFLSYANALLEQKQQIESMYQGTAVKPTVYFSVASQRYPFAVDAFIRLLSKNSNQRFSYKIKETGMYAVIDDVYNGYAEVGVIFTSNLTDKFIRRLLDSKNIEFQEIQSIVPRVFMRQNHPLSCKKELTTEDLNGWVFMSFEQDPGVSLVFSEEVHLLSFKKPERRIQVYDRATAYNLLIHTDVITLGSGLLVKDYVDERIVSRPLADNSDKMKLGWIKLRSRNSSAEAVEFVRNLEQTIKDAIEHTEHVYQRSLEYKYNS